MADHGGRMRGNWLLVVAIAGATSACASSGKAKGAGPCEPVPEARRAGLSQVYAACEVDVAAKWTQGPTNLQYTPSSSSTETCAMAELDIIVDASGSFVRNSAVVVRSTSAGFTTAVIAALPSAKFTPAKKNGLAVAQLFRYAQGYAIRVTTVGRTQSTRRNTPARC